MTDDGRVKNDQGYAIAVDRDLCVTLAVCLGVAPDVFELDAEGKAVVKNPNGGDLATLIDACKSCPVNALILYHPNGKRIWPDPEVDGDGNPVT
ncbi:ferredoxin [Candidatus Gracilibacteria bacterium]|nr:ferredoxin [Candidatus Gracilibacteria bacterium]